ncbi:hypothetical protein GCM10010129_24720 [Streptomyces fumigatiscleroticus]|nr:hypothetical protein GCM10010129_24720 [Streptomyces fumigatiscleroticus]
MPAHSHPGGPSAAARPARSRPATAVSRWPAGPASGHPEAGILAELGRLRPVCAAAGLGLGIALASDPQAAPAGPAEEAAAAAMPPHRRREFLAGRLAARRALRAVGLDCGEIPRAGRLPLFPPGRAASISHSAGVAVAVARAPDRDTHAPLGCDLELRPLPAGTARLVLREDEEELLSDAWPVTSLFSAKEAAWKALHRSHEVVAGSLRDLRAEPYGDGLRIATRSAPELAVHVRVAPVGPGVFSCVLD